MNYLLLASLFTLFAPLVGCLIAGLGIRYISKQGATVATVGGMSLSFLAACVVAYLVLVNHLTFNQPVYTWVASGTFRFDMGLLIDPLSAVMMLIVTFVSLLVHIYSVGYMQGDAGYKRFFAYMSLFTFSMLLLVTANNFLQLFFGWEGVGLVSYLLIGFWFNKKSAASGSLKAFLVNRVGDFGLIVGVAAVLAYFGTLNYEGVFTQISAHSAQTIQLFSHTSVSVITLICVLLFIGAMGKSAQIPLHVWLPESMEGPTPISALIHAATMVTAGVYMVARLSPLYEHSVVALSLVMVIGALGGLFLGILALVEFDIKRVIAYSTMSQLGYMMAANGASAFSAGIFHLLTHACFKALLFLAAGSVIIAMHHEQDLRKMGGLRKYLPVTYITFLIGSLALAAIPPFAGFYSKDVIIEAVHLSTIGGASFAYYCLLIGGFVTSLYIFRAFFLAFHGKPRWDDGLKGKVKEPAKSMVLPLIILAIPSTILGAWLVVPMLFQTPGLLGSSITVLASHNVLAEIAKEGLGPVSMVTHAVFTMPFWFAVSGVFAAWLFYLQWTSFPAMLRKRFSWVHAALVNKYGFDQFNDWFFVRGSRRLSNFFYRVADLKLIDSAIVNGSGRAIGRLSSLLRFLQSGYLYHYLLVMVVSVLAFLIWLIFS